MSPVAEISLIAGRELRKSIRSVKGIILGILTLLGSLLAAFVCIRIEGATREEFGANSTDAFTAAQEKYYVGQGVDGPLAHYMASIPLSMQAFLTVMIWLGPLLVALLGFDSISGDIQHRGVRYWTVRSRRWSYLLGKFFGLWGIVASITGVLTILSGILIMISGYIGVGAFIGWGVRFWIVSTLIAGTWTAVAIFVSSRFKTPILALLVTFGAFFAIWLTRAVGIISRLFETAHNMKTDEHAERMVSSRWYEYLYPNGYDDLLLSPKPLQVAAGLGGCFAYMIIFVGLATLLFARRDV